LVKGFILSAVILGLVPRIWASEQNQSVADARDKPEHDGGEVGRITSRSGDTNAIV
jgi:hypothetical protein